jgi:serine phosphatase RsbU (regulator of sigma subunit)/anti-sigma regulatory factor (Ser/Thr protein kinase)
VVATPVYPGAKVADAEVVEPDEPQADLATVLADAALALHGEPTLSRAVTWATAALCDLTGASECFYLPFPDDGLSGIREPMHLTAVRRRLDQVMQRGQVERIDDVANDPRFGVGQAVVDGMGSLLAIAVRAANGTPHGYLLARHNEASHFTDDNVHSATVLADHLGTALDRHVMLAELAAAQREIVHELQEAVLPPSPDVANTELGRYYVGAESAFSTGGDIYDWTLLPDGDLQFAVIDIMGKGVSATKDALTVTHALRLMALEGCPLGDLLAKVDPIVTAQSPDLVATLIVGRYSPATGHVRLVGGGHPPALLVHDGTATEVTAPGIALGWPGAGSFEVVELTLERGDTLILYTDGLIESGRDIIKGLETLRAAAEETAGYPAASLARALVDRALAGAVRQDDSLALVLRRRVPPSETARPTLAPFEYRFSPNAAAISLARNLLEDWLVRVPVEADDTADLILVASELCTNAVRHARGPGGVALRAHTDGADVVLEVEDDGGEFVTRNGREEPPDAEAEAGRGLFLVDALTDECSTRSDGSITVVRCRKKAVLPA